MQVYTMETALRHLTHTLLLLVVAGCATGTSKPDAAPGPETAATAPKPARAALSLTAGDVSTAAREAAAALAGGLAVMDGMEERKTPALEFRSASIREVAERLAQQTGAAVSEQDGYVLLYPGGNGYEAILALDLSGQLSPRFRDATVALEFAPGTSVYTLFSVLGQSMGTTVIADNALAETRTGLLSLPPVPFATALKAVLQSARVDPAVVAVESTGDYVFLYVPTQEAPGDLLLNRSALTATEREYLNRRVSVILPEPLEDPRHVARHAGARPLNAVLPALSAQLGMEVTVQNRFREIPVNPAVMHNVTVETALDLLIRQWPVPVFGYEVRGRSVLIRHRPAGADVSAPE